MSTYAGRVFIFTKPAWYLKFRAKGPSIPIAWATAQRRPRKRSPYTKPQGQRPDRSRCSAASRTRVVPLVTQITPTCFLVPANGDG